jgi:DNA-directed RNA polymerase subunit RPC12/RpoP
LITVGKRREDSPTYALTWRGFIASLVTETVIGDIPSVLRNNPLLKFDLPHEVPKEMVINVVKELFTPREIGIIARALLVGFLRALPRNIESIKQENYIAYLVPGLAEVPEIREKFEEKDLTRLLQIPGLPELALDLIKTYEGQLSEVLKGIQVIKRELTKYMVRTTKIRKLSGRATMTPPPKDAYVCKRCGYVLPKKDAVISGWDSQSSLRHVHCPKCGKIITHSP